jgi:FKBP-type peptidyl-prolyl cis-trans isomerase
MKKIKFLVGLSFIALFIISCDTTGTWKKHERAQIDAYIKSLGDTAYILKPSGLYYIELSPGTGRMPIAKDTVYFRYTGMFIDRVVFDSNMSEVEPFPAVIGNYEIIPGLDEGIRYMKEGEIARFVVPSSLAYGAAGIYGIISGYTPLLFEVELTLVLPGPGK